MQKYFLSIYGIPPKRQISFKSDISELLFTTQPLFKFDNFANTHFYKIRLMFWKVYNNLPFKKIYYTSGIFRFPSKT